MAGTILIRQGADSQKCVTVGAQPYHPVARKTRDWVTVPI